MEESVMIDPLMEVGLVVNVWMIDGSMEVGLAMDDGWTDVPMKLDR